MKFFVRIRNRAKWHDPNIQLDLASYKLQSSYGQMFLIFKDIDDIISRETFIDKETAKALMERLDKAFKEMGTAKSLADFVVLLMAKSEFYDLKNNTSVTDNTTIDQNSDLPVISNSEPEIFDEVYEEYIKEEYRKPYENKDEYSLEQHKLDNLLAKSFMSELKEALVDKYKSMSERESKALQRMYKNITRDLIEVNTDKKYRYIPTPPPMPSYYIWSTPANNDQHIYKNITEDSIANAENNTNKECQHIPIPPPMPSYYIQSMSANNEFNLNYEKEISTSGIKEDSNSFNHGKMNKSEEIDSIKTTKYKNVFNQSNETYENENKGSLTSLPKILLETQATKFAKLPPAFLQEEIFVGSGENSEDEVMDNISDNDEDNKNS